MKKGMRMFEAVLERLEGGLGWTIVRVPFAPHEAWKTMIRHRVKGTVNGVPFRTSLFPFSDGSGYFLLVNRASQREAGVVVGSVAEFTLEADLDERPAELPEELALLLDEEKGLREFYDSLSESMRREIGKWIGGVKSDASRMKRCEQMAERLLGAMEGEQELPPVVAAAFRRRPKAAAGWQKLTATQRRQELMAVYYYQSPEAREKRVGKLCDLAERKVGRD